MDTRNAMLRYAMRLCVDPKPPTWEEFFPPEEDSQAPSSDPNEKLMLKLNSVMAAAGSGTAAPESQQNPELDAFRKKMWRLMGIEEVTRG